MSKQVHVQIGLNGLPIRIFRDRSWRDLPADQVQIMDRASAVYAIRVQVFDRAEAEGGWNECERCGRLIGWNTFEMNEILPKGKGGGKTGGEVSVENCEALCKPCHQTGPDAAHSNRRWHTAKIKS
jgi:5-methylcytosine-specific restriction endonuclease McrA